MTDTRSNHPLDPRDDQVLDQHLAALGRFSPGPGFEDRVMARVRIPAPVPSVVPEITVPAVRRRRWPAVAWPLSGAAAVSSTALTVWATFNLETMAAWSAAQLLSVGVSAWQAALTWLASASASLGSAVVGGVLTGGVQPLIATFVALNLAVPVSMLGLYLVARPAVRMRSHAH
jgi:hypothetical protein